MLACLQHNRHLFQHQFPGYEALGAVCTVGTNYIVRVDALRKCEWLPTYSKAVHHAMGEELRLKGYLSFFLDEVLATGEQSPQVIHQEVAATSAPESTYR